LQSAHQHIQNSLNLLTELGYDDYKAEALAVLAENNLHARNVQVAQQNITEAFESDELYGPYRLEALRIRASIALALNDQPGTIEILLATLREARENNYPYHEAQVALQLARVYGDIGEVDLALAHVSLAEKYFAESEISAYYEEARVLRAELEVAKT
jgi:hypothetical protein